MKRIKEMWSEGSGRFKAGMIAYFASLLFSFGYAAFFYLTR